MYVACLAQWIHMIYKSKIFINDNPYILVLLDITNLWNIFTYWLVAHWGNYLIRLKKRINLDLN